MNFFLWGMCRCVDETVRNHAGIERREVLCYQVQLGAYSELEILAAMREDYQRPVHLTFNSPVLHPRTVSDDRGDYPKLYGSWLSEFLFWRIQH